MSTTYGAMIILAVLSVVMYVVVGVTDLAAQQRAVAAADLAALSAADLAALSAASDLVSGGDNPCAVAGTIAGANQASVSDCHVEGEFVRVTVAVNKGRGGSATSLAGPVG